MLKLSDAANGKTTGDGTGVGFFIPLPPDLAREFPPLGEDDRSPPHCTFLYVGNVTPEREAEFLEVSRKALSTLRTPVTGVLGGLTYFNNPDKGESVAVQQVRFSRDLAAARWNLLNALTDAGFEVQDSFPLVYRPHVTRKYLKGLEAVFEGSPIEGAWAFDGIGIWGLPKDHTVSWRAKTARPIQIDRGEVRELARKIADELVKVLSRYREPEDNLYMQRGFNPTTWGFFIPGGYRTTDVRGFKVDVPVHVQSRNALLGFSGPRHWVVGGAIQHRGHKGDPAFKYALNIVIDSGKRVQDILANISKVEAEVYSVLVHEVTHLRDLLVSKVNESKDNVQTYYNDPTEIRAFMRQVLEEVLEKAEKAAPDNWSPLDMWFLKTALEDSPTWSRVRRHMTPQSQNLLLKGVYAGFQEELPRIQALYQGEDDMVKTAEQMVKVWHVSPEANIQKFQGRYSPKFKTRGLFVAPEREAINHSWAGYVSGKKFKDQGYQQGTYDNLTVYTLQIPAYVLERSTEEHDEAYLAAKALCDAKGGDSCGSLLGAWGWDAEVFIPERFLKTIRIVGRKTQLTKAFGKEKDTGVPDQRNRALESKNRFAQEYLRYHKWMLDLALKKQVDPKKLKSAFLTLRALEWSFASKPLMDDIGLSPAEIQRRQKERDAQSEKALTTLAQFENEVKAGKLDIDRELTPEEQEKAKKQEDWDRHQDFARHIRMEQRREQDRNQQFPSYMLSSVQVRRVKNALKKMNPMDKKRYLQALNHPEQLFDLPALMRDTGVDKKVIAQRALVLLAEDSSLMNRGLVEELRRFFAGANRVAARYIIASGY